MNVSWYRLAQLTLMFKWVSEYWRCMDYDENMFWLKCVRERLCVCVSGWLLNPPFAVVHFVHLWDDCDLSTFAYWSCRERAFQWAVFCVKTITCLTHINPDKLICRKETEFDRRTVPLQCRLRHSNVVCTDFLCLNSVLQLNKAKHGVKNDLKIIHIFTSASFIKPLGVFLFCFMRPTRQKIKGLTWNYKHCNWMVLRKIRAEVKA